MSDNHDPRSTCNRCNSYKFGEHQTSCEYYVRSSNEDLLDDLIYAAGSNNEFDNRREVEYYRSKVLNRMKKNKDK